MNVEPSVDHGTTPAESTHPQWADDGGVLTEERPLETESTDPDTSFEVVGSETPTAIETDALEDAGAVTKTSIEATSNPVVREPLLTEEAEQAFLTRWAEIQVGFVEDPAKSVRDADGLIEEIASTLLAAFQERRTDLAADWRNGSPGTEELRLALRRYRAFIGVILPK